MRKILLLVLLVTGLFAEISPTEALRKLKEGNQRYIDDQSKFPNRGQERRNTVYSKQKPYAIILSCSDSRVPPEIVFDQGIGDLFVVRVAGNVIDPVVLDSIEYAALHLNSSIIVVMGHENCGAVSAVVNGQTEDIEAVAELIDPAVKAARKMNSGNLVHTSILENAIFMKNQLLTTPVFKLLAQKGAIQVVAAYYDLETGKVHFLKD